MANKLYVGNLPYDADESALRTFFGNGKNGRLVTRVRIVTDRETGQRRGFAFVELNSPEQVKNAIATLNGKSLGGRSVVISEAHETSPGTAVRPARRLTPRRPPRHEPLDDERFARIRHMG